MATKKNNDLDTLFDYGIDLDNRTIYLTGDIDEDTSSRVIKALFKLDRVNLPITVYIDSYGGSIYSMFAIYDAMTKCTSLIKTVVIGKAMSAAVLLAACGDKGERYAYPNATFMIHDGYDETQGTYTEIHANYLELKRLMDTMIDLLGHHTEYDLKAFKAMISKKQDTYLNAFEAATYGLVDKIL